MYRKSNENNQLTIITNKYFHLHWNMAMAIIFKEIIEQVGIALCCFSLNSEYYDRSLKTPWSVNSGSVDLLKHYIHTFSCEVSSNGRA